MANVFIFPGQGSQEIGMGKALCDAFHETRELFEEAESVMSYNLRQLMFEGPLETLSQTQFAQPALFTLSCALWHQIKDVAQPRYLAGHSLGEYSALHAATCFDFSAGLSLVNQRGRLMAEAKGGAMMALVGTEALSLANDIITQEASCYLANDNGPDQVVISGSCEALEALSCKLSSTQGMRAIMLKVSGAFHSPFMLEAQQKIAPSIHSTLTQKAIFDVITNVSAQPRRETHILQQDLIAQMTRQVRWRSIMTYLDQDSSVETAWEVGPRTVLKGLARQGMPRIPVKSLATPHDIDMFYKLQA